MALAFDAHPQPASAGTAVNPAKLRDEIHRLSQRLVRARESYNQDFLSGDPEVPLDEQLAIIESYSARLDLATEQLRQHDAGAVPASVVPEQPSPVRAQPAPEPGAQSPSAPEASALEPAVAEPLAEPAVVEARIPEPRAPEPARHRAPTPGPGITNPDGTPLLGDGTTILRTEGAAVGEYVRHAADQRWLKATGRSAGEFDEVCDRILAALAHKHGVELEDERQLLARQVDARYRRDYG